MPHTKLLTLIESAKEEFTHDIPATRVRAVESIIVYMQTHDKIYWNQALSVVIEFLICKLSDKYTLLCASNGLIFCMEYIKSSTIISSYESLVLQLLQIKNINLQQEPQATRNAIYRLYMIILEHFESLLFQKTIYRDHFLENVLSLFEGEKDPRNLLLHFQLYTMISKASLLESYDHNEDILHAVLCYFPISFTPPPNDRVGIKSEDLVNCLTEALVAMLPYTWEWTLQAIMDRLGSSLTRHQGKNSVREILLLVAKLLPIYHAPFLMQNAESIGQDLMQESWIDRIGSQDDDLLCSKVFMALIEGVHRSILSLNICNTVTDLYDSNNINELCSPLKELMSLVLDRVLLLLKDQGQRKSGRVKSIIFLIRNIISTYDIINSILLEHLSRIIIDAIAKDQELYHDDTLPWMLLDMLFQEIESLKSNWKNRPALLIDLYDLMIGTLRNTVSTPLIPSEQYMQVMFDCLTRFIGPLYSVNIDQLIEIQNMLLVKYTLTQSAVYSKTIFTLASNHKELKNQFIPEWISRWWNSSQDWNKIWEEFMKHKEWSEYVTFCIIDKLLSCECLSSIESHGMLRISDILYGASKIASIDEPELFQWMYSCCSTDDPMHGELYQFCRIISCIVANMREQEQLKLIRHWDITEMNNHNIKMLMLYVILSSMENPEFSMFNNAVEMYNSDGTDVVLKWYIAKYVAACINRNKELYIECSGDAQGMLEVFVTKAIVLNGVYSECVMTCIMRIIRGKWLECLPFGNGRINPFHVILDKHQSGGDYRLYHCKRKPWYVCGFLQNIILLFKNEIALQSLSEKTELNWSLIAGLFSAVPNNFVIGSLPLVLPILEAIILYIPSNTDNETLVQIIKLWTCLFNTSMSSQSELSLNIENCIGFMSKIMSLCDHNKTGSILVRYTALELLSSWNEFLIFNQHDLHVEKIIRFLGTVLDDPKRKVREQITKIRNALVLGILNRDNPF